MTTPIDPSKLISTDAVTGVGGKKADAAREGNVGGPSFADFMKKSILEVADLKKEADVAIQDLQLGKTENVSEVFTAVEKADIAFRALMSIRNKLVDAYQEINRLRV